MTPLLKTVVKIAALALGVTAPALGQETPPERPPEPAAASTIAPVDVPWRADADERFAREVAQRARQHDSGDALSLELARISEETHELRHKLGSQDLSALPVLRLESLENHTRFHAQQLEAWRDRQKRVATPLANDSAALAKLGAEWEATRSEETNDKLSPALLARIESVLSEINRANQALSAPLGKVLALGPRAAEVESELEASLEVIESAINYQNQRLATVDAPPLWRLPASRGATEQLAKTPLANPNAERDFFFEFLKSRTPQLGLFVAISVLLLPLLLLLSHRDRELVSNDPELQSTAHVLHRPVSSWLVLVLLGFVVAEPGAPVLLRQLALLLSVVPALRILPRKVFAVLGRWPYVASALYVLNLFSFQLTGTPAWYRLYILAISILGIAGFVWLLQRTRQMRAPAVTERMSTAIAGLCLVGIGALLTSAVSNVFGNVSLANMLTDATLDSSYFALAIYAAGTVLSVFVKLALSRRAVSRFQVVTQRTGPLLQSLGALLKVAAFVIWVVFTLNQFRVYRPIADWLRRVLTHGIEIGELTITLGSVVLFALAVYFAFWTAKTIRVLLSDEILPKMDLPRGVGNSISTLSYYALIMVGLLIALAVAGFQVGQFAIVLGALGVGIGFGLQGVVNNFVSGLILMFERPIQPGDVVEVAEILGRVTDIGIRATKVKTFTGAEVVVPNGMLLSDKLVNWTLSDMNRRLEVNVGVAYGTDPAMVVELLTDAAKSTPGILDDPPPHALFVGFGASSLDFTLRAWTNDPKEWLKIQSDMAVRVNRAIRQAGIEIPFPQRDLHLRSVSPEISEQVGAARISPQT